MTKERKLLKNESKLSPLDSDANFPNNLFGATFSLSRHFCLENSQISSIVDDRSSIDYKNYIKKKNETIS